MSHVERDVTQNVTHAGDFRFYAHQYYDGDRKKPITFKMHGTLDAVQATTAALGPVLHGFAGEPEAKYFYGQAANELAVISTTDWDAGMPSKRRRRAV